MSTGNAAAASPSPDTIACRDAAFREISPDNRDDANVEAILKAISCVDRFLVDEFRASGYRVFPLPPGHYESYLGFPALAKTFAMSRPDRSEIVLNSVVFVEPEQAVSVLAFQMQTVLDLDQKAKAPERLNDAERLETEVHGMYRARKVTHDLGVRCGADQYLRPQDVTDPVCQPMSRREIRAAIKKDDKGIHEPIKEVDLDELDDKQTQSDQEDGQGGGLPPAVGIPVGSAAVVAMLAAILHMKKGRGGRNKAMSAEATPAVDAARVLAAAAPTTFTVDDVLGGGCAGAAVCVPAGGGPLPQRAPMFAAPVATPLIREDAPPGQTTTNELVVPEPATLLVDNSGSPPPLPEGPVLSPVVLREGADQPSDDGLATATQTGVVVDASAHSIHTSTEVPELVLVEDDPIEEAEAGNEVIETVDGDLDVVAAVVATTEADNHREDHPLEIEVQPAEPFRNTGAADIKPVAVSPAGGLVDEGDPISDLDFLNGSGVLIALP